MAKTSFNRRDFIKMTGLGATTLAAVNCSGGPQKLAAVSFKPDRAPRNYGDKYESLKVGLCQICIEPWAVDDNLRHTIESIETAARQGAEIAVTPECVLHGYGVIHGPENKAKFRERLLKVAEPIGGKNIQLLCAKAKELNIYVLIGFAERGTNERIHNSAALISPGGDIIDVYRKVHSRPHENINYQGLFTPGDKFSVNRLKTDGKEFKAGTIICFDREIPETIRCLRSLGAEIIFCPLATPTHDITKYKEVVDNELVTRCRALENEVFIVVVNLAGGRYNGGSFVVGPEGEVLCQLGNGSEVRVVDVPVGVLSEKFHGKLRWMGWGHRRQAVYDKYLKQMP